MVTNLFEDSNFTEFCGVFDGKLKQLNRTGKYVEKKKAGVITVEMEEKSWESGLLGDHSPHYLVDTVLFLIRLNFTLRSGEAHCRLRHFPYLTPLKNPKCDCWYSNVFIGHNKLSEIILYLMRDAGIPGYFTNHSLRAITITRMYDAQLDDTSIMQCTGHTNVNGMCTYKRSIEKLCELTSAILNQSDKLNREGTS